MNLKSEYQVMARTMRPQRFCEVVGQTKIKQTLAHAFELDRLGHAYLFCGPHGTGKTTLARLFAKVLNCDQPKEGEPCNTCSSCLEISGTRSLNVIEIDGASNRGIEDIRQINESVGFAAQNGKYKIYIIDEVHMLTKEAFNALLKTLEDPPLRVKFFFATTEPHKVPATILSRCQCFYLQPLSTEEIANHLEFCAKAQKVTLEKEAAFLIAQRALGSLRDALVLADQLITFCKKKVSKAEVLDFLGILSKEQFFNFDLKASQGEIESALLLAQSVFETGKNLSYFLDTFCEHYRQILYIKIFNKNPSCLPVPEDEWPFYEKSASYYSYEQCLHILDLILEAQTKIKTALSKRASLEHLLMQIVRSFKRVSVDEIVQSLEALRLNSPQEPRKEPVAEKLSKPESKKVLTQEPKTEAPAAQEAIKEAPKEDAKKSKSRYDTVLQFAAVELEGSLKKEGH